MGPCVSSGWGLASPETLINDKIHRNSRDISVLRLRNFDCHNFRYLRWISGKPRINNHKSLPVFWRCLSIRRIVRQRSSLGWDMASSGRNCASSFFSCILAVPLGISAGIFLAEYTVSRPIRSIIDFAIDLLAGMPSIIMGLFGFAMVLFLRKTFLPEANTCLLLSSICIAFLVLPYLIRTTQTALAALPAAVRLTGVGLGFTKWQNILHVLIPLSSRGIMSGVILSIGRAAEDTAVILLTGVVANSGLPGAITDKFEALPFTIYYLAAEYRTPEELNRGFGAALVLLILTGTLFQAANWLHNKISGESR